MPRIRTIKPDFFSNEEIGNLPAQARLLFIGLWTLADCEGRLQDRPMRIAAQLFPYDSWPIPTLLENLAQARLITRYEAEGKKCIQIINFLKHQRPHPKETNFGLPPCREITGNSTASPVDSHVLDHGLKDHGLSAAEAAPAEQPAKQTTSERESKSRFSLKECEEYAASRKGIKSPKAYGKTIWRSGEDDDAIGDFLGNSGKVMKKQPDKPVDVAEINRLADDLDAMKHHEAAQALRASIQGK
jgi:hypothetical protein